MKILTPPSNVESELSLTTPIESLAGSATSFSLNLSGRQSLEPEGSILPPSSPPSYLQSFSNASETGSDIGDGHGVVQSFDSDSNSEGDVGSFPMDACTGQLIKWEAGSIWDTYAYPHHDDDAIGWMPIGYESGNFIRLQSKSCNVFLHSDTELNRRTCDNCFNLLNSKKLKEFMDRSKKHIVTFELFKHKTGCYLYK